MFIISPLLGISMRLWSAAPVVKNEMNDNIMHIAIARNTRPITKLSLSLWNMLLNPRVSLSEDALRLSFLRTIFDSFPIYCANVVEKSHIKP